MAEKEELHKVEIKKVLGPTSAGTAVLLGNDILPRLVRGRVPFFPTGSSLIRVPARLFPWSCRETRTAKDKDLLPAGRVDPFPRARPHVDALPGKPTGGR